VRVTKTRSGNDRATVSAAARHLDVGEEPDPRFTLANERTFLAWARTALGSLVAGLAVAELLRSEPHAARLVISIPLIVIAGVIGVMSYSRWRVLERALRLNRPLPYSPAVAPLSIVLGLVALAAVVVLVVR
jgi:putative membrane protein